MITVIQLVQMAIGVALTVAWSFFHYTGRGCACQNSDVMVASSALMYGSYFCLFFLFFTGRYNRSSKGEAKSA